MATAFVALPWYSHLFSFLATVFVLWFSHLGTTVIGLGCGFIPAGHKFWIRWRGGESVRSIWKEIGLGAAITLTVWAALFLYCLAKVVYEDHRALVEANTKLHTDNEGLRKQNQKIAQESHNPRTIKSSQALSQVSELNKKAMGQIVQTLLATLEV